MNPYVTVVAVAPVTDTVMVGNVVTTKAAAGVPAIPVTGLVLPSMDAYGTKVYVYVVLPATVVSW